VTDAPVVGQWVVTQIDSASDAAGWLQVGWNTPMGAYAMVVTSPVADTFTSAGKFSWDGSTLILIDSAGKPSLRGSVDGGLMTLGRGPHSIALLRLVELPH
jgi:hypothetical protein